MMRSGIPLITLGAVLLAAAPAADAYALPTVQPAGRQVHGPAPLFLDAPLVLADARHKKHNAADVRFVTMMISHHREAVQMARLIPARAQHTQLKRLGRAIVVAQTGEIAMMERWLRAWGQPIPPAGPMPGMPGGMSEAEMARLAAARGASFDRLFVMMMLRHHQGAIKTAGIELAKGVNPDARRLAASIQRTQGREVARMRTWQAAWAPGGRLPSTR
jgi:uncharacterized protein (DUF305 family)